MKVITRNGFKVENEKVIELLKEFYNSEAIRTRAERTALGLNKKRFILSFFTRDIDKSNDRYFERKCRERIQEWESTKDLFCLPYKVCEKVMSEFNIPERYKWGLND